jgi:hypothetical protein
MSNLEQKSNKIKFIKNRYFIISIIAVMIIVISTAVFFFVKHYSYTDVKSSTYASDANKKLQEITNMDFDQIKYLIDTYPELLVAGATPKPLTKNQLNDTKLIEIIKKLNNQGNGAISFKYEYIYNNQIKSFPLFISAYQNNLNSKIYTLKVFGDSDWKEVNLIDGIVNSYSVLTKKYTLDYYGAKYAIKNIDLTIYDNQYTNKLLDPDLILLLQVAYSKEMKDLGKVSIDGITYVGFEIPASIINYDTENQSETEGYYYTFYVNPQNFSIEKQLITKGHNGDKDTTILLTQNTVYKKYLTGEELTKALEPTEIAGIPIKEFSYNNSIDLGNPTLENFSKTNDFYYIDFPDFYLGHVLNMDQTTRPLSDYEKAQNTTDFNPDYIPETNIQENDAYAPWFVYYQGTGKMPTLGYEMYKSDPTLKPQNEGYKFLNQHEVSLSYNGSVIKAVYMQAEMQLAMDDPKTKYFDSSITFKAVNGYYYVIRQTFFPETDGNNFVSILDKNSFPLLKLNYIKAKEFDTKNFTEFF